MVITPYSVGVLIRGVRKAGSYWTPGDEVNGAWIPVRGGCTGWSAVVAVVAEPPRRRTATG